MSDRSVRRVMIGTAGHIDHGKSSLVEALTGTDPDTLKEEKERGLTIDMGRAVMALPGGWVVGIIDVPGHERFIKNMVAGASSFDLALLVVAADDGVMPQTREHLEILTLLKVQALLVALTKVDLIDDPELLELAVGEVVRVLEPTPFAGAPILPVSSVTGQGLPELRAELARQVGRLKPRKPEGLFRLPVQRIFRKQGFGSVLGGVPVAGQIGKGETVEVLPAGLQGRLRGVQTYGQQVETARAGHSCALNLPDIPADAVHRGSWAVAPGLFRPDREGIFFLDLLPSARALPAGAEVRLHLGTAEIQGRLLPVRGRQIAAGASGLVRLKLEEPTLLVPGDRFILRLQAPPRTIGGGIVVLPGEGPRRLRPETLATLAAMHQALGRGEGSAFLEHAVALGGLHPIALEQLARLAGRSLEETRGLLEQPVGEGRLVLVGRDYLHAAHLRPAAGKVLGELDRRATLDPLSPELGKQELASTLGFPLPLLDILLARCREEGSVEFFAGGKVRKAGSGGALTGEDQARAEALLELFRAAGFQPLEEDEARARAGLPAELFQSLVRRFQTERRLVRVGGVFLMHADAFQAARQALIENCRAGGTLDIPALRDRLHTSRKFVIPLLEYSDGIGLTARRGSVRVLRDETAGA